MSSPSGPRSQTGRVRPLLVACTTLVLPIATILGFTLSRPTPAPAAEPPRPIVLAAPVPDLPPEPLTALAPPAPPPPLPTPTPRAEPFNPFPRWTREPSTTFLILGIDRREPNELYRTDSILLANVDLRTHRASVISIPRDLVVSIPSYYQDRINTVYALGEMDKRPGGGIALLRQTVERNFGVPINHYVALDFNCFRAGVDALGGVYVTVPERIYDPYYPTEDYGYKVVTFEPGRQWLSGDRALEYARTRFADTDFGRMRRQQQLLTALRDQALQVKTLAALPRVAGACGGMSSDLSLLELAALGASARDIRPADVALRVIDEKLAIPYTAPSGAAVLLPRWDEIRALVRATFPSARTTVAAVN